MILVEDVAEALYKLYAAATPRPGSGPPKLTLSQCSMILQGQSYIASLNGKVINVDFSQNILNVSEYEKANKVDARALLCT